MIQKRPHEWNSKATCDDGQDKDVDIARPQLPIRSIERQNIGSVPQVQHLHDHECSDVNIKPDVLKEALKTSII